MTQTHSILNSERLLQYKANFTVKWQGSSGRKRVDKSFDQVVTEAQMHE